MTIRPKNILTSTVGALPVLPLEPTEDRVWLSKSCRCRRYVLRGVPGKLVDVLIDDRGSDLPADHDLVISVVRKAGHFDGTERDRITVRAMQQSETRYLAHAEVAVTETDASISISISRPGMRGWKGEYARLRSDLDRYCLPRIVMWHWRRYYAMLPMDEVTALADSGTWLPENCPTLSEANRAASRALYRLARDLGWRKLTLRERTVLRLDSMWVDEATYSRAHDALGHPTGCGETTIAGARSSDIEYVSRLWRRPEYQE
jgi:hypothetical protein